MFNVLDLVDVDEFDDAVGVVAKVVLLSGLTVLVDFVEEVVVDVVSDNNKTKTYFLFYSL